MPPGQKLAERLSWSGQTAGRHTVRDDPAEGGGRGEDDEEDLLDGEGLFQYARKRI